MTYCWKCKVCGTEQDVQRPVAEIEVGPTDCSGDKCASVEFTRIIGKVQFQLVGYGWAKDNYSARMPGYRAKNVYGTD